MEGWNRCCRSFLFEYAGNGVVGKIEHGACFLRTVGRAGRPMPCPRRSNWVTSGFFLAWYFFTYSHLSIINVNFVQLDVVRNISNFLHNICDKLKVSHGPISAQILGLEVLDKHGNLLLESYTQPSNSSHDANTGLGGFLLQLERESVLRCFLVAC